MMLLVFSAFFSASETAFTCVNRIRLKNKAEEGSKRAKSVLKIIDSYDKCLTTLLIGNNIVNITMSSVATLFCIEQISESNGAAISTIAVTIIVLIFGEIIPKTLARAMPDGFCLAIGTALRVLMFILTPISAVFLLLQRAAKKLFGSKKEQVSVTEQELLHIIDEIEDEGVLEEQESDLVRSALEFDEKTVGEILTPRVKIIAVDVHEDLERVRDIFIKEEYTRLPVYEKSVDHIIGVISYKDFLQNIIENKEFFLSDIILETMYVPSLMKISDLLRKMQREKMHLAVVIDQYGGTEGIVTLEDVLEELVGEIWDEDDIITQPAVFRGKTSFELSGELSKSDFNRFLEMHNMDFEICGDFNTVGGWAFEQFGRIPSENDSVETDRFKITVVSMNDRRIGQLRFDIIQNDSDGEKDK